MFHADTQQPVSISLQGRRNVTFTTRKPRPFPARRLALPLAGVLAAAMLAGAGGAVQGPRALPFGPGEECTYRGSNFLGRIGTGTMGVDGPERLDGRSTFVLRFDFSGRVGPARVEDHTRSWFDPAALASFRYTRRERSPLGSREQDVAMDPVRRRWASPDGGGGAMPTATPLDELSFIYFIRTLPLRDGDAYSFDRHYEQGRNPVRVRVIGRGELRVPAGRFRAVEVEMRVKDPTRYGRGEGVVQLHFSDDARRLPLRIESNVPRAGRLVLSLEAHRPGAGTAQAAD
jgi:hypothetical protein